jgi:uncharacterized protein YbjT (DUF2867 family)
MRIVLLGATGFVGSALLVGALKAMGKGQKLTQFLTHTH